MTVSEFCPHRKVQRSDCLVCVLEDNRRETRAELARELLEESEQWRKEAENDYQIDGFCEIQRRLREIAKGAGTDAHS